MQNCTLQARKIPFYRDVEAKIACRRRKNWRFSMEVVENLWNFHNFLVKFPQLVPKFSTTYRFPQLAFRFQKLSTTSFLFSTTCFLVSVLNFHNFQYVNSQNFRLRRFQNTRKSSFESSKITLNSTQVSAFSPVELNARRRRDFFCDLGVLYRDL